MQHSDRLRQPRMKPSTRKVYNIFVAAGFGWVRGQAFYEARCGRYSARLYELRRDFGWEHETRPDPTSSMPMYRLYRAEPEQQSLRLDVAS